MGAEAVLTKDTSPPLYEYFYVARQPIFDNHNNTYGYELLFRSGADKTVAEIIDQDYATLCVATCGLPSPGRPWIRPRKFSSILQKT